MDYKIHIKKSCEKELDKLPPNIFEKIKIRIQSLASNPFPGGVKKLKGVDGYRIREGEYRILYKLQKEQNVIEIFSVGHRKDIYRF